MNYITIAVSDDPSIVATAKHVSRSLDPDTGGAFAFNSTATDSNGATYRVYGTPCTDQFYSHVEYFKSHAAELTAVVNADIDARWPDVQHITLDDAIAFCASVRISSAYGILAGLDELGLVLNVINN